jgi:lipoate-protein ligase A
VVGAAAWPDWEWELIEATPEPAHLQMALDEVLLGRVAADRCPPTLRFWTWADRALVLGSHQSVANEVDVDAAGSLGFLITRRMSGGGTMLVEPGRTITYSIYASQSLVDGMSFIDSFAFLDAWVVETLREIGVPAEHRPINDIVSPRGKIGGAAQARRSGALLHHTTLAHSMDTALVGRLIRIGRPRLAAIGIRSAEKEVSPLDWFTDLSTAGVEAALAASFSRRHRVQPGHIGDGERHEAERLVEKKYATGEWISRLP